MSNVMGILTMCRRAGKLRLGMDMAKDGAKTGEAKAMLVATDISEKTLKEIRFVCAKYNNLPIYSMGMTMNEVGFSLGKTIGVAAVCDKGFAEKISTMLEKVENNTEIS